MKNRNKIWQPETAAYKRFQFPVHDRESIQERNEAGSTESEVSTFKEKSYQTHAIKPETTSQSAHNPRSPEGIEKRAETLSAVASSSARDDRGQPTSSTLSIRSHTR